LRNRLLDHLVGAGEQRRRDGEVRNLVAHFGDIYILYRARVDDRTVATW